MKKIFILAATLASMASFTANAQHIGAHSKECTKVVVGNENTVCSNGITYAIVEGAENTLRVTHPCEGSYTGEIEIPATVEVNGKTYTVTGVENFAFAFCDCLREVKLPETVSYIGSSAFYACNDLQHVNVPLKLKKLDNTTFRFCEELDHSADTKELINID